MDTTLVVIGAVVVGLVLALYLDRRFDRAWSAFAARHGLAYDPFRKTLEGEVAGRAVLVDNPELAPGGPSRPAVHGTRFKLGLLGAGPTFDERSPPSDELLAALTPGERDAVLDLVKLGGAVDGRSLVHVRPGVLATTASLEARFAELLVIARRLDRC